MDCIGNKKHIGDEMLREREMFERRMLGFDDCNQRGNDFIGLRNTTMITCVTNPQITHIIKPDQWRNMIRQ